MEYKKFVAFGIKPREGVILTKYLVDISLASEEKVNEIIGMFKSHEYDLSEVPGSFYKVFTKTGKEINELEEVLTNIDAMNIQISEDADLKAVFQADLRFAIFTPGFIARIKFCMDNDLPYLYEDNTFISELFSKKTFAFYSSKIPIDEIKTVTELTPTVEVPVNVAPASVEPVSMQTATITTDTIDFEDLSVKNEIVSNLTKIMEANGNNPTLNFLIGNIIDNLSGVIASNNKAYRTEGTRSLVEGALQGINITPDLKQELDEKVLKAFPDFRQNKEGVVR